MGTLKIKLNDGACNREVMLEIQTVIEENPVSPEVRQQLISLMRDFILGSPQVLTVNTTITASDKEALAKAIREIPGKMSVPAGDSVINTKTGQAIMEKAALDIGATVPAEMPKFPYVNNGRTLGVSLAERFPGLAEMIAEAADAAGQGKNIPHLSGIKFSEDGKPLFKARVLCCGLNCGKITSRFTRDESVYIKCPACETKHKLRRANPDAPQDDKGFFLIADQIYSEGMNE